MNFEWDEEKNQANIRKHGFDFADAWEVFPGPLVIDLDLRRDYGEARWIGIGLLGSRTVVVTFTLRGAQAVRIISLRKASRHERKKFEQEIGD
ncbi:MAG TPA: BrnT family toxin [Pyrinomonadaceae bacterium]|nr:BrnT family toxin [Pyrinomonadaceae bacterium]